MDSKKEEKKNRGLFVFKTASLVLALLLIFFFVKNINFSALVSQIGLVGWKVTYVLWLTFFSQLLAVIAWYLSFNKLFSIKSVPLFFAVRLAGESFAQVSPVNIAGGDPLKGVLLKHLCGIRLQESAMSIFLSRIMITLSMGFMMVFGIIWIHGYFELVQVKALLFLFCVLIVLCFVFLFYSLRSRHGLFYHIGSFFSKVFSNSKFVHKAVAYLYEVDKDLVLFYHEKRLSFYTVFILSIWHQIIGSMEFYIVFRLLGFDIGIISCIVFGLASSLLRAVGFFVPGQIGIEELTNKIMFSLAAVPGDETWLTVSLIRRARQVFWIALGTLFYFIIIHTPKMKFKALV